jgi:hypothetical protein
MKPRGYGGRQQAEAACFKERLASAGAVFGEENSTVNRTRYLGRLVLGIWLIVTGLLLVVTMPTVPLIESDE